jgi:cytochrome c peroxidase
MRTHFTVVPCSLVLGCVIGTIACRQTEPQPQSKAAASTAPPGSGAATGTEASDLRARAKARFAALPAPEAVSPAQAALGRRLFFEARMSADQHVGCVNCHLPERWGADGQPVPKGVFGRENARNAPTVFNAFAQNAEHWRADRTSVEDQASRALNGPASFGLGTEAEATEKLHALKEYAADFHTAFPGDADPVSVKNWGAAIGAYERTLTTPAPFDAWLGGDDKALDEAARAGLSRFISAGCPSCHDGALLGGNKLRKFGVEKPYADFTHSAKVDQGRFDITQQEADRFVFKVAGLRNVERTGPYFHDGSVASLPEAVQIMSETQLGKTLDNEAAQQIVAFLKTVTGPVPANFAPPR